MPRADRLAYIFCSAFLMSFAFHPIGMHYIALFALYPLLYVSVNLKTYRQFAFTGYVYGLFFYSLSMFWLNYNEGTSGLVSFITFFASVLYLSLFPMLVFIALGALRNRIGSSFVWLPFIWVSVEYVNSIGQLGFPWFVIGSSMAPSNLAVQIAEFTGIYGVSFWIVLSNVLVYDMISRISSRSIIVAAIVFILPHTIGTVIKSRSFDTVNEIKIGMIQPNISQSIKWDRSKAHEIQNKLISLTKDLFDRGAMLVFWPESSVPTLVSSGRNNSTIEGVRNIIPDDRALVAGLMYKENDRYYNSAAMVDSTGIIDIYSKLQLVPIAERVPLSGIFPALSKMNIGAGSFSHGEGFKVLNYKGTAFGTMICFESIFPHISAGFASSDASFLVYLVNDGWYEKSPEPAQHFNHSIVRAIETRRSVARVTNRGISAVINEYGEVEERIDEYIDGTILATISPITYKTFYTKFGNLFAKLCMLVTLVLLCISIRRRYYE